MTRVRGQMQPALKSHPSLHPDCRLDVQCVGGETGSICAHRHRLVGLSYFEALFRRTAPARIETEENGRSFFGVYPIEIPCSLESARIAIETQYDSSAYERAMERCDPLEVASAFLYLGADSNQIMQRVLRPALVALLTPPGQREGDDDRDRTTASLPTFVEAILRSHLEPRFKKSIFGRLVGLLPIESREALLSGPASPFAAEDYYVAGTTCSPQSLSIARAYRSRDWLSCSKVSVEWNDLVFETYHTSSHMADESAGFWLLCHPKGEELGQYDHASMRFAGEIDSPARFCRIALTVFDPLAGRRTYRLKWRPGLYEDTAGLEQRQRSPGIPADVFVAPFLPDRESRFRGAGVRSRCGRIENYCLDDADLYAYRFDVRMVADEERAAWPNRAPEPADGDGDKEEEPRSDRGGGDDGRSTAV